MNEKIYTPQQIAKQYQISVRTVTDMFRYEPGAICLCNPKPGRRKKVLLRVPQSVVETAMQKRKVR